MLEPAPAGSARKEEYNRADELRASKVDQNVFWSNANGNAVPYLTCCFVGVSFYKTLDGSVVYASSAQVFNERGQGLIVRGSPAKIAKNVREIHVTGDGGEKLITGALAAYRGEHKIRPAGVVVHKSSGFDEELNDLRALRPRTSNTMAVARRRPRRFRVASALVRVGRDGCADCARRLCRRARR